MYIMNSPEEYRKSHFSRKKSTVTIGKFDGIHRGHMKLIEDVVQKAHRLNAVSVVFCIETGQKKILSEKEREEMLSDLGADVLIKCPFSREFMQMTPQQFAEQILKRDLHAVCTSVGVDFRFGNKQAGDAGLLKKLGSTLGFTCKIMPKLYYRDREISSTWIRQSIEDGDMELVQKLLGRPYGIDGIVEHGRQIGTRIGIPTVNISPDPEKEMPPNGVYATRTTLPDGRCLNGLTNSGTQPTVGGNTRKVETWLLQFEGNLYGQPIRTEFLSYLRPEVRFGSIEQLQTQIHHDLETAAAVFERNMQ